MWILLQQWMLFSQQVFHLECLFWLFDFFNFATWVCICIYPVFHWDDIVDKVLPKAGGLEKNIKTVGCPYRVYGLWSCFSILCIYFQMNSIDFAHNIWLQIVFLLALHQGLWLAYANDHGHRIVTRWCM